MIGDYFGLPGQWRDDPTAVDGKRFIATLWSWRKIKDKLRETVNNRCEVCRQYDEHGDGHHVYGRGGGKRDDRPVVFYGDVLIRMILYLCRKCHEKAVIQRWGSWRDDAHPTTERISDVCQRGANLPPGVGA